MKIFINSLAFLLLSLVSFNVMAGVVVCGFDYGGFDGAVRDLNDQLVKYRNVTVSQPAMEKDTNNFVICVTVQAI